MIAAIVLVLACIVLPAARRAQKRAYRISCTSNLKQIGLGAKTWAIDNKDLYPWQALTNKAGVLWPELQTNAYMHFLVMSNELASPRVLVCPADAGRSYVTEFQKLRNQNTSYFVGLDANGSTPQIFMSGDRNLTNGLVATNNVLFLSTNSAVGWSHTIHSLNGNIGLADGSVQQFTSARLKEAATYAGGSNRLLMP